MADIFLNAITLSSIVGDLGGKPPYHTIPGSPLLPLAFARIMQGASSVPNFISIMASHLNFYSGTDGFIEVSLLTSLWHIAVQGTLPIYSDLLNAHRMSAPLWTSIFSLLRRTVSNERDPLHKGTEADFIGIVLPLTNHACNTLGQCNGECTVEECAALIERWVAADFFRTLDIIIPFCAGSVLSCSSTISLLPVSISDNWHFKFQMIFCEISLAFSPSLKGLSRAPRHLYLYYALNSLGQMSSAPS
jgi:hypothetical protein